MLHVASIRKPSLTALKETQYNPYAGYRRVQFQKKKGAKQNQKTEASSRSPTDNDTCVAVMDTAEPSSSTGTRSQSLLVYRGQSFSLQ